MDKFRAYDRESVTVADSAIGFTDATMNPDSGEKPDMVKFIVETAQIRYTLDGKTDPTTAIGLIGEVGDFITIEGQTDAQNFKAIRTGGTSATIQPQFFTGE